MRDAFRLLCCLMMLALAIPGCADDPALTIKLRAPASLLDLAKAQGTMTVELLDGNTEALVVSATPALPSLASRQKLFSQLDLIEQRLYRVRVKVTLEGKTKPCGGKGAVGQSPVFRFSADLQQISVYVDCADTFSQVGGLLRERFYHTATFLPEPRPHGQVLVVGGGKLKLAPTPGDTTKTTLLASIEAFDPDTGKFRLLTSELSEPRIYHKANAVDDTSVLITGGMSYKEYNKKHYLVAGKLVERLRGGQVTGLRSMEAARGAHTALLLSPNSLFLAGGYGSLSLAIKQAEIFDPVAEVSKSLTGGHLLSRSVAAAVAYDGGRKVLIAGGRPADNKGAFDEIFCAADTCPCGKGPCFQPLAGFSTRMAMTGTLVSCVGGTGAIYLVGGSYTIPLTKTELYYKDIVCFDTTKSTYRHLGTLHAARTGHTATLVRGPKKTRRLLIAGGATTGGLVSQAAELFPVSCACPTKIDKSQIQQIKMTGDRRVGHSATTLADGTVLLTGGAMSASAERFNPSF